MNEPGLFKEDGFRASNGFLPVTPSKTLNCALNTAVYDANPFYVPYDLNLLPSGGAELNLSLSLSNMTTGKSSKFWDGAPSWMTGVDSGSNNLLDVNRGFSRDGAPSLLTGNVGAGAGVGVGVGVGGDSGSNHQYGFTNSLFRDEAPSLLNGNVGGDTGNPQQSGVTHVDAENRDDEVIATHQKSKKKQKVGLDMNRKPGEKRKNKYYWAKIDVPRPRTPAPKTPKVVTPKPPKPETPKSFIPKTPKKTTVKPRRKIDKRKPTECSKFSQHVKGEPIIGSSCKRSLIFGAAMTTGLEPCNVQKVVETAFEKTAQDTTCPQGLNLGDGSVAITDVKPTTKTKEKSMIVYRRRFNSKCVYKCRNMVPKFEECFKKKRLKRKKMPFGALKRFEGFNRTCLVSDLLVRILSVKGKLSMLMPTKVDLSQSFTCVLSLLSSRAIFMKKKRLHRARCTKKQPPVQDEPTPCAAPSLLLVIEPLKVENNGVGISTVDQSLISVDLLEPGINIDNMQPSTQQCETTLALSTSKCLTEECRESKPNVVKEKKPKRTYKRKGKPKGYLWELTDKIMEDFALQFRSLKLIDDPKAWIVEVSHQDNNTDDFDEKMKLEEERSNLFRKIRKFLQDMYYYQGSKKFIKWNGSVLDSVVGVFLTQNVSDILSSNAFINMASKYPKKPPTNSDIGGDYNDPEVLSSQGSSETVSSFQNVIVEHPDDKEEDTPNYIDEETMSKNSKEEEEYDAALREMVAALPELIESKKKGKQAERLDIDWEKIRVRFSQKNLMKPENEDSVDWEAVRKTNYLVIADIIRRRGQHRIIAFKIQKMLNRLVDDHGSLDLEWLRDAPPIVAKAYLLSFYGLGLKSVECLRLLTLHHHGFPVDVNISRIAIRLGWVPIKPLPPGMPFHLLQKYPLEDEIQRYLWPRLCHLKQEILYHLHYQMITFGKVFCSKRNPNCRACPFKTDCKYYASLAESRRQALPGPSDSKTKKLKKHENVRNPFDRIITRASGSLPCLTSNITSCSEICVLPINGDSVSQLSTTFYNVSQNPDYFVEVPSSPSLEVEEDEEGLDAEQIDLVDIEDCCDGYMYHLKLNADENKQVLASYSQGSIPLNVISTEMISVSPDVAFNPLPKQVNVARLRTEHQVYELPRENQLLNHLNLEAQLGDVPYLLAIWTPGQIAETCDNTNRPPCLNEDECTSSDDTSTIPGTLLLPVQTAMRRSFPLNGTYFQMNEVFADHETSEHPFKVPTNWIWNLKKRTLYCGSSTSAIVKGTTEMEIRQCFREGFVCTRGFDRRTRAPEALSSRFHKRPHSKAKPDDADEA